MNFVEFENDISLAIKAHSLTLNRNKKEIKLILILHISYEVIEIKIYENSSNKLVGREILTYGDIFQIFNDYFICLNENMQKIYEFINNCIRLKNCEAHINEVTKTISLEIYILKDNKMDTKKILITSCADEEKLKIISNKIKELNALINIQDINEKVAPLMNYIKYENNLYCLYVEIYIEKEIEILVFKTTLITKTNNNDIINIGKKEIKAYAAFYSKEEINKISKNYYESISSINEISDDIKINISNKNIKIDNVSEEKIKITVSAVSSINIFKISFELIRGLDIKDKYIQIIKDLKLKNEILANKDIFQNNNFSFEPKNKIINTNNNILNKSVSENNNSIISNEQKKKEKKLIGKKRKRISEISKKKTKNNNKNKGKNDNKNNSKGQLNKNDKKIVKKSIENALNTMLLNMEESNNNKKIKKNSEKGKNKGKNKKNKKNNKSRDNNDEHFLIIDNNNANEGKKSNIDMEE